jgi:hypothetical protein
MFYLYNFDAMKKNQSNYQWTTTTTNDDCGCEGDTEGIEIINNDEFGKLVESEHPRSTAELIDSVTLEVSKLLKKKNKDYGDTANNPPQIFSQLTAKEGILARIDDKLSRIKKLGFDNPTDSEDTLKDLIGYLILLKVQIEKEKDVIRKRIIDSKPKIK